MGLERTFYDWGVRSTDRNPSDKIAVIAIDDESIANFESWPWPRDLHAVLIDRLKQGGAKVIGQTVLFVDPQRQARDGLHQGPDRVFLQFEHQ